MVVFGGAFALVFGCVEQTDEEPTEEDLKVIRQNVLTTPPTPRHATNSDLDGKVVYLGIDVDPDPIEPGKDVKLTHYWKVITPPGEGWRAFTHLHGPNRQSFINVDHTPVRGKYPVARWKAGEIIRDEHTIRLPQTWAHDKLEIYTGMWKANNRLTVKSGPKDAENRVLAATIPTSVKSVAPRKRLLVKKTPKPLKIDGKLDEPAWKEAASSGAFVSTMTGAAVEQSTEAKALWDDKYLYLAFEVGDKDAWTSLTKHDDKLWTQEAIEVMIDADGDGRTYVELQVAPNGTTFDTYLPEYRKYEDAVDPKRKQFDWTPSKDYKVSVKVDGTVNKREDQDKGWTVEMAVPMNDVKGLAAKGPDLPPKLGQMFRANFFRMDVPQGKSPQASAWAPPLVGDFHALDKFGELVFADEKGQTPPPAGSVAAAPAPGAAPGVGPGRPGAMPGKPMMVPGSTVADPRVPTLEIPPQGAAAGSATAGAKQPASTTGGASKGGDVKGKPATEGAKDKKL